MFTAKEVTNIFFHYIYNLFLISLRLLTVSFQISMAAIEIFHLSLPLFLCFFHCYAQTQSPNNTIKLGSSIIAGSNHFWRSSSGDFAFRFHQIVDGRYLVGILFDKIPERTLAWSANRDDPAKTNSTIILKPTGQFVLIHANNTQVSIYNGTATSSAFMSNNGNFMLLNSSSNPYGRASIIQPTPFCPDRPSVSANACSPMPTGPLIIPPAGSCWKFKDSTVMS